MKNLNNKVAAITGAASGIGQMVAVRLAAENCNLALSDVNEAGLEATKKMIGNKVRVSLHKVDVGKEDQVYQFAKDAAELYDKEVFITTADDAARIIVKGIKKNQRRVMVGRDAKLFDFLTRMFPKSMVYMSAVATNHMARKYAKLRN